LAKERAYLCIDMKSFYASVECAERCLNPFETNLVVADVTRGKNALCLAISPKLKSLGVKNRCRLSEIPSNIEYIIAPPRMALYIEYAADIYAIYLNYFSPEDIHTYSIDESFIDVTNYLIMLKTDPVSLAKKLMNEIADKLHIPSTAGIGTNLYLAKIALDITAKHAKDHIGILNEESYKEQLWDHKPITDFWMVASGTAKRLESKCIFTMRDITTTPENVLYKMFGINAELLIDHAWGREPCLMSDIKKYKTKSKSVSFSQILPRDYTAEDARTVLSEMTQHGCHELMRRKVITKKIFVGIGYSGNFVESNHGTIRMGVTTAVYSQIIPYVLNLYDKLVNPKIMVRRLAIGFEDVCDESCEGYDLFTDFGKVEREKEREKAILALYDRYGKNAVLKGTNYLDGATQKERNEMIGGHRAGYDDKRRES